MRKNKLIFIFGAIFAFAFLVPGLVLAQDCELAIECDDSDSCTEDWCAEGACMHEAIFDCEEEEEMVEEVIEVEEEVEEEEKVEAVDEDACEVDEDCEEDMKCLENECVEEHVECKLDEDCLDGEVCILGYCLFEEEEEEEDGCVFDEDCEDGQVCEDRHCVDSDEPVPTLYEETEIVETEAVAGPATTTTSSLTNQEALFGFIPINQTIQVEVNEDTGQITSSHIPWWSFLSTNISASEAIDIIVDEASEILNQALNSSTSCEEVTSDQLKQYSQTMKRVHYFKGQLLSEDDLQSQLSWTQQKLQLRTLHGITQNCPNMWQAEVGEAQTITMDLIPDKYKKIETKRAKLFGIIGIDIEVEIEVNAESGEEQLKKKPWWSFLAKIVE